MSQNFSPVRKAAVLGSGVMGAQIAAHLAAAGIPTLLFDLPADKGPRDGLARNGIESLGKLKPPPLASKNLVHYLQPANFEDDLDRLEDVDFVIEAVAERLDIKKSLFEKLTPHLKDSAILASNTSGLSIIDLARTLPDSLASRFCGVHFFNPPRYMHLVELIPHSNSSPEMLDFLEEFMTSGLGKGVVRAKDTPNFIGNRVGVFAMLAVMHHAEEFGLGFDTVDALTGPAIGRPKSATFRLADVVGLDTMGHVIGTMADKLEGDPWHGHYRRPAWLKKLIEAGALGQKTGAGVFRKEGKAIRVLDPQSGEYRDTDYSLDDSVKALLAERDPARKLAGLADSDRPEAQFLWAIHRDLFHYCATHLAEIADSAREVDLAMRWGYGWNLGPFEQWQAAGWKEVAARIEKDIEAGRSMAGTPLPGWVAKIESAHGPEGSYSAADGAPLPRPDLEVFDRQYQQPRLLGERTDSGTTVAETDGVVLWHLKDDVLIASFRTRMNVISPAVIDGMVEAVRRAEKDFRGLVIWQPEGPFSAGADLKGATAMIEKGDLAGVEKMVADFQAANLAMRYSTIPVVAAVRGLALGGGLEVVMHCDRAVAALESYMGLVEAGVGLVPAGGGLATLARRVGEFTLAGDTYPLLEKLYKQVAMGQVAGSAMEAMEMGYLEPGDRIVLNEHELLHAAHGQVRALDAAGYRPPLPARIPAAGDVGIATLRMILTNMHEGGFISDHDEEIGKRIATVLCGGAIDRATMIDEAWIHRLEREHFVALASMKPTQERIGHMLKTGKPLRN